MASYLDFKIITLMAWYLFACISDEGQCCSLLDDGPEYDPSRTYNFPTYYPTAIDTKRLKTVITKTPLRFDIAVLEKCFVQNTGKSATVQIDQKTKDGISGGILKNRYIFEKYRYHWTNRTDSCARAASTVDDIGEALELLLIYWNEKYCNFTHALNFPDGLVLGAIPIQVGLLPNPGFIPTQVYLAKVKKARTQVPAELGTTYLQYGTTTPFIYYAYPGSYKDEITGKDYFCATVIAGLILQRPFISRAQFQSFLNLRDADGKPLTNQARLYRDERVPMVRGIGAFDVPQIG